VFAATNSAKPEVYRKPIYRWNQYNLDFLKLYQTGSELVCVQRIQKYQIDRIFLDFDKSPPQIFEKCSEKNSGGQNVLLYHRVSVETIKSVFYRGNRFSSGVDPSFNYYFAI
jgi:hypothetical protein